MTSDPFRRAFEAIEARDLETLRGLLADHPELAHARSPDHGGTLLHDAAYTDDVALCTLLVEAGCSPAAIREKRRNPETPHAGSGTQTPLALAVENGKHAAATYLARLEIVPDNLWMAASLGDLDRVRAFFDAGGRLTDDARDPNKMGDDTFVLTDAMVAAAHHGHDEVMRFLIDRGADPSGRDQFGMTALHYAVQGHRERTETLLDLGADPTVPDFQYDATPCGWARFLGHEEIVHLLEARGEPDPRDRPASG